MGLFAFAVGSLREYCDIHSVVSRIAENKWENLMMSHVRRNVRMRLVCW